MKFIIPILESLSVILSGIFGMIGVFTETKLQNGKLTKGGRNIITGIILTSILTLTIKIAQNVQENISETEKSNKLKIENEKEQLFKQSVDNNLNTTLNQLSSLKDSTKNSLKLLNDGIEYQKNNLNIQSKLFQNTSKILSPIFPAIITGRFMIAYDDPNLKSLKNKIEKLRATINQFNLNENALQGAIWELSDDLNNTISLDFSSSSKFYNTFLSDGERELLSHFDLSVFFSKEKILPNLLQLNFAPLVARSDLTLSINQMGMDKKSSTDSADIDLSFDFEHRILYLTIEKEVDKKLNSGKSVTSLLDLNGENLLYITTLKFKEYSPIFLILQNGPNLRQTIFTQKDLDVIGGHYVKERDETIGILSAKVKNIKN